MGDGMTDLAGFLLARLAGDEAAARAATPGPWTTNGYAVWRTPNDSWDHDSELVGKPPRLPFIVLNQREIVEADNAAHIARHDPARVLAEVAAKRQIVEECTDTFELNSGAAVNSEAVWLAEAVLKALAQPYADHSDFDSAWKVEPDPNL